MNENTTSMNDVKMVNSIPVSYKKPSFPNEQIAQTFHEAALKELPCLTPDKLYTSRVLRLLLLCHDS